MHLLKSQQPQFVDNSSKCLTLILTLPNDETLITFLAKSYEKKRAILIELLSLKLDNKQELT